GRPAVARSRRAVSAAALCTLGTGAFDLAGAQAPTFPSQPVRFIIPTPPGGGHDTMMRLVGQKLTEAWGQPSVVESKPGASGAIAATTVAQGAADGHTVLIGYSALISNTVLLPKTGYRLDELRPVCMLAL